MNPQLANMKQMMASKLAQAGTNLRGMFGAKKAGAQGVPFEFQSLGQIEGSGKNQQNVLGDAYNPKPVARDARGNILPGNYTVADIQNAREAFKSNPQRAAFNAWATRRWTQPPTRGTDYNQPWSPNSQNWSYPDIPGGSTYWAPPSATSTAWEFGRPDPDPHSEESFVSPQTLWSTRYRNN